MTKHILAALSLGVLFAVTAQGQAPAPPKSPYQKLAEPWPDAAAMRQRKADAETLRLFTGGEPIAFTLAAYGLGNSRAAMPAEQVPCGAQSQPVWVILRGEEVFRDGRVIAEPGSGQLLP